MSFLMKTRGYNMKWIIVVVFLTGLPFLLSAQQRSSEVLEVELSLDDVIELAGKQSLYSFRIRNMYLSSYWEFRSFRANRLPSLIMNTTPIDFDRSVASLQDSEGYRDRNMFTSDASLSVRQNVPWTGGVFDVTSSLSRIQNIDNDGVQYASVPVSIGFTQSLNGYNQLRWESRIEPLKRSEERRVGKEYRSGWSRYA